MLVRAPRKPAFLFSVLLFQTLTLGSRDAAAAAPLVLDRLEASVNSSLILLSDVKKFRETQKLRTQLDPIFSGTAVAAKGDQATNQEIVQFLIDERLIQQEFPVGDPEVEQEINSIQANNRIDRASLRSALAQQGFRFEDYFELIRVGASKRNLIDRDIRTKVVISDDDVKNYFYNHYSKSSATPMEYHLRLISITPTNYKTPAAAKEAAQRAYRALQEGEPFEEVAKRVSDDMNASSGGDLGNLGEDQMSPLIREQIKRLQIGQYSGIFGNPTAGYFILKLVDVKSGDPSRYDRMKEEIRNQLFASEYRHQIGLWLERRRQGAFIHLAGQPSVSGIPTISSGP